MKRSSSKAILLLYALCAVSCEREEASYFLRLTPDMNCPSCKTKTLEPIYTQQGVEVDFCTSCKGIWLDKGEIFYFTKKTSSVQKELDEAIKDGKPSEKICPRTGKAMQEIALRKSDLLLDYSPASGGLWFDGTELAKLTGYFNKYFKLGFEKPREKAETAYSRRFVSIPPLPNLVLRSLSVLAVLYGLLTLILISLSLFAGLLPSIALALGIAIAILQFGLGPYITDLSLKWFHSFHWVDFNTFPDDLKTFIQDTCAKSGMRIPRMGMIIDGSPNAFTYGHTPNNARVVITSGLMKLLTEDEVKAVVAHEIGHAKNWDMLIMTAANLIPLVLYYIFRTLIRIRGGGRARAPMLLIAAASYILYIISEYLVLWLSRTREYFADRFSGRATGQPNNLTSALVKIGFGLAGKESLRKKMEMEDEEPRSDALKAMGVFGIFDPKSALAMVVGSIRSADAAKSMGEEVDKDNLRGVMKWDLWNPWALYYELHSTHPLIAKRINQLSLQSESMGKEPYVRFHLAKPESYWDEFIVDFTIYTLPLSVLIVSAIAAIFYGAPLGESAVLSFFGYGLAAAGIASVLKTSYCYRGETFPEMSVASLLKKIKASEVRPIPCTLKGVIIGKGVPGLIWSEDFVMQDESGIIFLDYRQPLPFWDFFFGILKAAGYQNKEATVTGWYRRSPVPYIELKSLRVEGEKERRCYTYIAKYVLGIILFVLGLLIILHSKPLI